MNHCYFNFLFELPSLQILKLLRKSMDLYGGLEVPQQNLKMIIKKNNKNKNENENKNKNENENQKQKQK